MKKISRYRLYEEDVNNNDQKSGNSSLDNSQQQTNTNNTTTNASPELQSLYNQLNGLVKQFNDYETFYKRRQLQIEREHTEKSAMFNNQISALKKQIADKGGVVSESLTKDTINYCKSKVLFESAQLSKADELCAAISAANDSLETLSYHIDSKSAMSFARKLLVFINEKYWNDGENHWDELEDYFRTIIIKSNISFSRRELNQFLESFENILRKNTAYGWIFGK